MPKKAKNKVFTEAKQQLARLEKIKTSTTLSDEELKLLADRAKVLSAEISTMATNRVDDRMNKLLTDFKEKFQGRPWMYRWEHHWSKSTTVAIKLVNECGVKTHGDLGICYEATQIVCCFPTVADGTKIKVVNYHGVNLGFYHGIESSSVRFLEDMNQGIVREVPIEVFNLFLAKSVKVGEETYAELKTYLDGTKETTSMVGVERKIIL